MMQSNELTRTDHGRSSDFESALPTLWYLFVEMRGSLDTNDIVHH